MELKNILSDLAANITRLTQKNTAFTIKNGFLSLEFDGKTYDRVFLHRAFPFDMSEKYISVVDEESNEIGIIYSIEDFNQEAAKLIRDELDKKYYQPEIVSISSLKERYGFSYWKATTKDGREVSFTVKDTFRSIIRVGENKAIIMDVDGNRFVIESIADLDKKSYRKIELYL